MSRPLASVQQVINALGGIAAVQRLSFTEMQIRMWKARGRIPPEHFLIVSDALSKVGAKVYPGLFGMTQRQRRGRNGVS